MKYLVILTSILICSFLSYENVTLRMENIEHVRYENQQNAQINRMAIVIEANETIIAEKDTVIDVLTKECNSLAEGVLKLFQMLQTERDMDQVT